MRVAVSKACGSMPIILLISISEVTTAQFRLRCRVRRRGRFLVESDGAGGEFDSIGIYLHVAVVQEAAEGVACAYRKPRSMNHRVTSPELGTLFPSQGHPKPQPI